MTQEQINTEIVWYAHICRNQHPDAWDAILTVESYSENQQDRACAEIAYYHERGALPFWATIIERVDVVNGICNFIHADVKPL